MKRKHVKWISAAVSLSFVLAFDVGQPSLQAVAAAVSTARLSSTAIQAEGVQPGQQGNGYAPSGYSVPHADSSVKRYQASSFPASYDLRSQNKVTSVKNQGSNGDCWAYAAMGSLESTLMPSENDDFSESDLQNNSGFDLGPNGGGNDQMTTAYLARWSGPLNQGTTSGVRKHVQNVDWLPGRNGYSDTTANNAIKQAILNGTTVSTPLYYNGSYYNSSQHSYYYNGGTGSNHEIDVVGWDDNYAASHFAGAAGGTPAHNGAFLCRNNWGTNWGDNGYFYVSYDDTEFAKNGSAAYDDAESTGNYSEIYQYDPLGFTASIPSDSGIQWMANVFTANDNNALSAVSFYTLAPSVSYRVYVIPQYTGSLSTDTRQLASSGTMAAAGYHTVKFDSRIALQKGNAFAVEVEFTTSGVGVALEAPYNGYSSQATASAGQSFISFDGSGWMDTTKAFSSISNVNVCLKAFTTAAVSSSQASSSGGSSSGGSSSSSPSAPASSSLAPLMSVDSPSNGMQYGNVTVGGWALNGSGMNRVDVYLDLGTSRQKGYTTSVNQARPDVKAALDPSGAYPGSATSGYSLTIPASDLVTGRHTVNVAAIGSNGTVQWTVRSFSVGPEAVSNLDAPAGIQYGDVTVAGWALNHAGMNRVDVYLDLGTSSQKFYSAAVNGARPDVKAAIDPKGRYIGSDVSGFSLNIPAADLSAGQHTVYVAAIGNDGTAQWTVRSFRVGPDSMDSLDCPTDSTYSGNVTVGGWALNHAGMNRVDAYLDLGTPSQKSYTTSVNRGRADVKAIVDPDGHYKGSNASGFEFTVSAADLTAGQHTLNVAAIGNDGTVQWMTRTFYVR